MARSRRCTAVGARLAAAAAVTVGLCSWWTVSCSATPVARYAGCVDVLAPNPVLAEVFLGIRAYLDAAAAPRVGPATPMTPQTAVEQARRADPEQIPRKQAVLDRIPSGGYAAYVRAVCPAQREFEGGGPGVSQVRWAMAFDGVTLCEWLLERPASEPNPAVAATRIQATPGEATGGARVRYSAVKLDGARRFLCPR